MIRTFDSMAALRLSAALIGALAVALPVTRAQNAPAPSAATLAKYDVNRNGVLDPDELAT